jgi:signal transduction histidine kinase
MVEFFKDNYPNIKYEDVFKQYATLIFDEMERLRKIVDFMLSYASSTKESIEEFSIRTLIENLLTNVYQLTFENENINIFTELENCILLGNKRFFEDIIQQLVSNSIKFLKSVPNKKIRCTGYVQNTHYILLFSDNGIGIPNENREKVFEVYFTTTSEQGGAGLGLWIAKMRTEAFKGSIEVIDNEFQPSGTTFKITLPFKTF